MITRSSSILTALVMSLACACATSPKTPVRLAVGSTFSCFACADQPVCETSVPRQQSITLPGADGLAWTDLRRIAAGSESVCALLGSDLHCWTYDWKQGEFSGPTLERGIIDFDLENRALCMVSRRGQLRCNGWARAQSDPHQIPLDLIPGYSSRDVDVSRIERGGRIEGVAATLAGACHRDAKGRATCWRWDAMTPDFSTPSDVRVLDLWPVAMGIELWTDAGVYEVEMRLSSFAPELVATPVEAELPAKTWIHGHAAACRVLETGSIECRQTVQQDGSEAGFDGWQAPPDCSGTP